MHNRPVVLFLCSHNSGRSVAARVRRYLDWELADPAGLRLEQVRPIVDEIDRRVRALLGELVPAGT